MALKSRKIYVWIVSLLAVLLIYMLVNRLYETPEIEIEKADELVGITGQFDSNVGKVGDLGVGKVELAVFKDTNREFGFEKLWDCFPVFCRWRSLSSLSIKLQHSSLTKKSLD